MILADSHMHTNFSTDSEATCESMVNAAIDMGLKRICITDHMDIYYPHPEYGNFEFNPDEYYETMCRLRSTYSSKIDLCIGVEFGLRNEPDTKEFVLDRFKGYEEKYDYDYIIGSSHVLRNLDPYVEGFWDNLTTQEGISDYFQSIYDNILYYDCFDSYGHADYIVRYIPDKIKNYNPSDYRDLIDKFLKLLIERGKALEFNTSGYKYGLGFAHPRPEIIRRYRELGGELLTIGSDAHKPEHLAYDFNKTKEELLSMGFKYYTFFKNRKPEFIAL